MTLSIPSTTSKVSLLPKEIGSLARGLPPAPPQTLFVLGSNVGMSVAPDAEFPLIFGRHEADVHVCVGADDNYVSRRHGIITREYSRWMLNNTGQLPIRLPGSRLVLEGDSAELPSGYTPLFIVAPKQEHLLQVRIAAAAPLPVDGATASDAKTWDPAVLSLRPAEKLVLVCLGQRYLRQDPQPQPLTWGQVEYELKMLQPTENWTWRRAAHIVSKLRKKVSKKGVRGLLEKEVPQPVGNALNHNLIMHLLVTTTIRKDDLRLLDG